MNASLSFTVFSAENSSWNLGRERQEPVWFMVWLTAHVTLWPSWDETDLHGESNTGWSPMWVWVCVCDRDWQIERDKQGGSFPRGYKKKFRFVTGRLLVWIFKWLRRSFPLKLPLSKALKLHLPVLGLNLYGFLKVDTFKLRLPRADMLGRSLTLTIFIPKNDKNCKDSVLPPE